MNIVTAIVLAIALVIVLGFVLALPVMWLWNWLMPELFGLATIEWLQAWGLLILCGLLFKSSSVSKS